MTTLRILMAGYYNRGDILQNYAMALSSKLFWKYRGDEKNEETVEGFLNDTGGKENLIIPYNLYHGLGRKALWGNVEEVSNRAEIRQLDKACTLHNDLLLVVGSEAEFLKEYDGDGKESGFKKIEEFNAALNLLYITKITINPNLTDFDTVARIIKDYYNNLK